MNQGTPNVLVTGANRGIGREFVNQCLERGMQVFAACRTEEAVADLAEMLHDVPAATPIVLDVGSPESIAQAVASLQNSTDHLDLLIHNAGRTAGGNLANLDPLEIEQTFRVNFLAPLLLTRECLPLLRKGARVAALTSRTGALRPGEITGGGLAYPTSKAALHRAIPILAGELRDRGILVCGIDPGWVLTDMTSGASDGTRYQLEPEKSVRGMLDTILQLDPSQSGTLLRWNGKRSSWYAPPETDEELQLVTTQPPQT